MRCNEILRRFRNEECLYDPDTKIWSGKKVPVEKFDKSIGELMLESLLKYPESIAQICVKSGKEHTNLELAKSAISIACHFRKLGFQQLDVVGFVGSPSEYSTALVIGALMNGVMLSNLHPALEKSSIIHNYAISKPKIVFCDGSVYDKVNQALKDLGSEAKIYTVIEHIPGVPDITEFLNGPTKKESFQCEPLKNGGKQIAFICCSSGTTGLSKGVCVTHESFTNANSINVYQKGDRIICNTTLYVITGIHMVVVSTLAGSTYLYSKEALTVDEFFDTVVKYKATLVFSPPSRLALCLASPKIHSTDLTSIRCILSGGASVQPSLIEEIEPFFPNCEIIVGYGMTEVPGTFVAVGHSTKNFTVGKLMPNVEMKVIDENNCSLGPNENGELCLRTIFPFSGYYDNPEANATIVDKDGWILTGDIGYVNDEGSIFIVDRKKEIFKVLTHHVFPTELETIIMEIPEVSEVCVAAIPDKLSVNLPVAMIVLKPGKNLNKDYVYEYVSKKVDDYKKLEGGVFFVDNIPKTPEGKPMRKSVAELCINLRKN